MKYMLFASYPASPDLGIETFQGLFDEEEATRMLDKAMIFTWAQLVEIRHGHFFVAKYWNWATSEWTTANLTIYGGYQSQHGENTVPVPTTGD